jgi:hypothetical protein
MVFNAIFNNLPVISWQTVLLMEETGVPGETTILPQIIDKLYHIMLFWVRLAISQCLYYDKATFPLKLYYVILNDLCK